MQPNKRRPRLRVTAGGKGVVNHAGARLPADLADATGLSEALSGAMAPTKQRRRGHDRGEVLVDLAVMIADGGETISDLAVLRNQPDLFGEIASHATAWRSLEAVDDAALERIKTAHARARAAAWAAGADPGAYVIDIDGTLIGAHSDKEGAAPAYKRTFGSIPCARTWTPPARPWPGCYARATPGPARRLITSRCWTTRSTSYPSPPARSR